MTIISLKGGGSNKSAYRLGEYPAYVFNSTLITVTGEEAIFKCTEDINVIKVK